MQPCRAPQFSMAAEPQWRPCWRWWALALVVALAAELSGEDHMHHRKFEMAVDGMTEAYRDWNPEPRHSEPNESMVTNYALDFEASLGLAPRFYDSGFAGGALEIYKEANVFLESCGCSWKGMCCEMRKRWMGTTGMRIGASLDLHGGLEPQRNWS